MKNRVYKNRGKMVAIRKKLCYNILKALYISNILIGLLRRSAVSENLTAHQRKISMLLFTENRNKCREVEQRCEGRDIERISGEESSGGKEHEYI